MTHQSPDNQPDSGPWSLDQDPYSSPRRTGNAIPAPQSPSAAPRPNINLGGLPWDYIIWGIGTLFLIVGSTITWMIQDEPTDALEQQVIYTVVLAQLFSGALITLAVTGLVWTVYRSVRNLRGGRGSTAR